MVWEVRSRNCSEKYLHVRSSVLGSFPLFWFFVDVVFVFCKRYRSGSNRTPPHRIVLVCSFPLLVPLRLVYRPFWPCVLSFAFFLGVPFWAPWFFFVILLEITGLSSLAPSEAFFGREAARVFQCFSFVVFVFPFCCVCDHTFLAARVGSLTEVGKRRSHQPLARVRARGSASCVGAMDAPFSGRIFCFVLFARGSQGPSDALRPGPFVEGRGRILPPQVFGANQPNWIADARAWNNGIAT